MAFSSLTNGVRVVTATTGTGTLTIGSTVTGFLAVPSALNGKSVSYCLEEPGSAPTKREWGRGTYNSGAGTLSRDTIIATTDVPAGGTALTLTSGATYISLTLLDDDIKNLNPVSVTCQAGTSSVDPLTLTSGTNLTSATNGCVEYDGNALMFTPSSTSRGAIPAVQFAALTGSYTLTSQTAAQKIFNVPSNGSLTVTGSTRYRFNCLLSISSMSGTSGNALFDIKGAGSASFTSALWIATGIDSSTPATAGAFGGSLIASSAASGNITTAATGTAWGVWITGQFRINAGGTIIPSIGLTTAAAAVVAADSFFECWPVSAASTTTLGNWT
jgi:hypothetical protein